MCRGGVAEQESLGEIATHFAQALESVKVLDSFGCHGVAEAVAKLDGRADDSLAPELRGRGPGRCARVMCRSFGCRSLRRAVSSAVALPRMRHLVGSLRRRYKQLGPVLFAKLLLFRALNVLQMDFHQRAAVQAPKEGYATRFATVADIAAFRRMGVRDDLLPDVSTDTNIVLVHEGPDGPNAFFWLGRLPFEFRRHEWFEVTLAPGDICGRFLWVAPEARGRGVDPALNVAADATCRAAGYTHIVSYVDTFNVASMRADAKIGYEKVVRLTMCRFLGFGLLRFGSSVVVGRFTRQQPARFSFNTIREFGGLATRSQPAPEDVAR